MPKSPAVVESVDQILEKNMEVEDFVTRPERVRRWFTNNILRRMLGYTIGFSGTKFYFLRCTSGGVLKTAGVGAGLETDDVQKGNAPDAYGTAIAMSSTASVIMVQIWDNAAYFKFSKDGTSWGDEMELSADGVSVLDVTCHSFNIKNKTGASVARYEVVGFW